MQRGNDPVILQDRMGLADLGKRGARILNAMRQRKIGRLDRNDRVQFCGLIRDDDGQLAAFLPRSIGKLSVENAALTMTALARFGREVSKRDFEDDGARDNTGLLSVIRRLSFDFRQNGLFSERQRVRAKNVGKPDWKRTASRERAFLVEGIGEIYPDIATTRTTDSSETLLAQVQAAVMAEIIDDHGWWIDGIRSRRSDLRWQKRPSTKRSLWATQLDALLPRLYSARAIFLATYLAAYLRDNRGSSSGSFVFGLEDFHTVWESMLRHTLVGVEAGWNERLPRARYLRRNGNSADAPDRGMLTDIILRDAHGLVILDAKYYSAASGADVPGWPDIAKQMFYEHAVRAVEPGTRIRNCFAFPAAGNGAGAFSHVEMQDRSGRPLPDFPEIECVYFSVGEVMEAYCAGLVSLNLPARHNFTSTRPA